MWVHPDLGRSARLERIDFLEHGVRRTRVSSETSKFIEVRKSARRLCQAGKIRLPTYLNRVVHQTMAVAWGPGSFLSRRASMIQVQPLKSMSIPTNRPMTQKPETGHCSQIMIPTPG